VIVAGGSVLESEILFVDKNSGWTVGPPLPVILYGTKMVSFEVEISIKCYNDYLVDRSMILIHL